MATITERFAYLLTLNSRDAIKGLNDFERSSERAVGRTEERFDRMGHQLTRTGAAMLSMGTLAGVGLNMAADKSNDLNEAINLTEQVFQGASREIGTFARQAPAALGQSERAAREAAADFGLLLTNMEFASSETVKWSKDLTVLASDMASFKNTAPEDAVLALGSALRGESEPIRRYGVMLDDASVRAKAVELGLAATTAEVDDHGKAQARLALIMEQTATLQGDFARTADEGANAARVAAANVETFQANIGQTAATIKNEFIGQANEFLGWFNSLDPATQQTISRVATFSTGILLLAGGLSTATGAAIKMRSNLQSLGAGLRTVSWQSAAATAAVGLLAIAWVDYRRRQDEAEQRVKTMVEILKELGDTSDAASKFIATMAEENDNLRQVLLAAGITVDDLTTAIALSDEEWRKWVETQDEVASANDGTVSLFNRVGDALDRAREDVLAGRAEFEKLNRVLGETNEAFSPERARRGALYAEGSLKPISEEATSAAEAISSVEQGLRELVGFILESSNSHIAQAQLMDDIADAAERIDELSYANARSEMDALATAFADAAGDMVEEGRKTEEIRQFVNNGATALRDLADNAGLSADEIDRLNQAIDAIDGKVVTADVQTRFFQEINRGSSYQVSPTPVLRTPTTVARSTGGPVRGHAIVGERGIESFEGTGTVRSNAETRLAGANRPAEINNHFYGPQSPAQIEAATRWAMRTSPR